MWQLLVFGLLVAGQVESFSSEGTRFLFAVPPASDEVNQDLVLLARQDTTVTVEFPSSVTETVDLVADEAHHLILDDETLRSVTGVEDKGVSVTAPSPVSAWLATSEHTDVRNPDATILRPIDDDEELGDIFISSYDVAATAGSETYRPKSFYQVVAGEDDTNVEVYHAAGGQHVLAQEFTLNQNQVFTEDDWQESSVEGGDYTGSFVRADKPVAVYAGHGAARVPRAIQDNTLTRYLYESMPFSHEMGMGFVTSAYHFGDNGEGYTVRAMSVSDGTMITVPAMGFQGIFLAGAYHDFDYPVGRHGTPVNCSSPCTVTQYANLADAGNSPGGAHLNPFMLALTPRESYSNDVSFSTPAFTGTQTAMTIITNYFPVEDLYLDGVNLNYLDWTPASPGQAGFFATLDIDHGVHNLYSMEDDHEFTGYVYGTYGTSTSDGAAFGYSIGYGDGGGGDGGNFTVSFGDV